jgi:hypothetical protein
MINVARRPMRPDSPGDDRPGMDTAKLALEDGSVFTGLAFGARGEVDGHPAK